MDDVHIEHAVLYSSGDMHVYNDHDAIEQVYPLADRIAHTLRTGSQVYRRRVIVVEDWEPVDYTGQRCSNAECRTCDRPARPPKA